MSETTPTFVDSAAYTAAALSETQEQTRREKLAQAAADSRNDETQSRADSRTIAAGRGNILAALAGSHWPNEALAARLEVILALLPTAGIEDAPALPQPVLKPTEAPMELTDVQAAWYLSELMAEFGRHKWPQTLQGAKDHWATFGRQQGRKWAANSSGWGPDVSKDDPQWAPKI